MSKLSEQFPWEQNKNGAAKMRGRRRLLIVFFCRDLEGGTFTVYTLGEGDTDLQNIEEFYTSTPEVWVLYVVFYHYFANIAIINWKHVLKYKIFGLYRSIHILKNTVHWIRIRIHRPGLLRPKALQKKSSWSLFRDEKKCPGGGGRRLRIVSRVITNYVFIGYSAADPKLFDSDPLIFLFLRIIRAASSQTIFLGPDPAIQIRIRIRIRIRIQIWIQAQMQPKTSRIIINSISSIGTAGYDTQTHLSFLQSQ